MTVASAMVAGGKAEVSLLNKYLKEYNDLIFGKVGSSPKKQTTDKEALFENMKGFRKLFGEKISFKAKVGKKLDAEFKDISLEELMKSENN